MGQLLALLRPNQDSPLPPHASLDINKALVPTQSEQQLIKKVNHLLAKAPSILDSLKEYHGCDDHIRKAISKPSSQNDASAWEAVVPSVEKLRDCYEFALKVDQLLPPMFTTFCHPSANGHIDVPANLEANQATAKAFADILSLAWEFDELKMSRPAIQNDFSYYRRTVSKSGKQTPKPIMPVSDETSGKMSLFYAYPGPFLKLITDTLTVFVKKNPHVSEPVSNVLFQIAMVCQNAVKTDANAPVMSTLRTMTGCLILYDHIHPVGLFPKASDVNIRIFVRTIQQCAGDTGDSLLNGLKFTGKTFNSPDVPKSIKIMFDPV